MGEQNQISQDLRKRIVDLQKSGIVYRKISNQLYVPISSVGTTIRHWKTQNSTFLLMSSRHPRKISEPAQRLLIRKVKEASKITLNKLQTNLKYSGVNVSSNTISRALHQNNIFSRSSRETPLLTTKHV